MKLTERKKMILIHIAWILALAVILWPLFTIAKYDYPSADDWSFGKYMYRAMQAGEGIAGVFLLLTALIRNFYRHLISDANMKSFGLKRTSRIKTFVFKYVSVPAKWVRTARQHILNIYTSNDA